QAPACAPCVSPTCDPCLASCPIPAPPSCRCDNALIGTTVSLGVVSGIILPICIALIFYYRRHAMATQSEQIPNPNGDNNQKTGTTYDVREYGASEV
ncbi:4060_t:CDS:2, partial [Cetraspora pellucida]